MRVIDRRQGCSCRDTLNDVVSMGVRHREYTFHPECRIRRLIRCGRLSRKVGFVRLVCRNVSGWILMVHRSTRNSLIKPKGVESLWTLFLLKVEKPCEKSSHDWNRGPGRGRFPAVAEFTDAKNSLVQHNGHLPRLWVLGSSPRVPAHVL